MTDSELLKIKEEYDRLVKKRNELKKVKDRMAELEKIKEIQEYIELYKKYESSCRNALDENLEQKTNFDLACRAVTTSNITPTTNIYCYIATCKRNEDGDLEEVEKYSSNMDVAVFANIESLKSKTYVIPSELQTFINNNVIIYPQDHSIDGSTCFYYAQEDFFATSVIEGKEKAIEKCKRYAKKGYPIRTI